MPGELPPLAYWGVVGVGFVVTLFACSMLAGLPGLLRLVSHLYVALYEDGIGRYLPLAVPAAVVPLVGAGYAFFGRTRFDAVASGVVLAFSVFLWFPVVDPYLPSSSPGVDPGCLGHPPGLTRCEP